MNLNRLWVGRLVGLGLLSGLAWGQPTATQVTLPLKVDPPEAVLVIGDQTVVPRPGGGYDLPPPSQMVRSSSPRLRAPGYKDLTLPPLDPSSLKNYNLGPFILEPDSIGAYLARNPILGFMGVGALVVGGGLLLALRKPRVESYTPPLNLSSDELEAPQEAPAPPELGMVGQTLGDYVIRQKLGAGNMATVYLGYPAGQEDDDNRLAIKVISPENVDVDYLIRFDREIEVSKKLNHPNVMRVLDWCREGELTYLVMEFVDGAPLSKFIQSGGLEISQAMKFIPGIIQGLAYAHSLGIVHRDLKPENVMVSKDGVSKVMDFGLARNRDVQTVTSFGFAVGTPAYMAPEQILRGPDRAGLTNQTDQYALGILLFELLAGRHPFDWDDPIKLITMQLSSEAPGIRSFREDVPEAVEKALQRMMSKEPANRFPSVKEAGEALYSALLDVVPGCAVHLQTLAAIPSPPE